MTDPERELTLQTSLHLRKHHSFALLKRVKPQIFSVTMVMQPTTFSTCRICSIAAEQNILEASTQPSTPPDHSCFHICQNLHARGLTDLIYFTNPQMLCPSCCRWPSAAESLKTFLIGHEDRHKSGFELPGIKNLSETDLKVWKPSELAQASEERLACLTPQLVCLRIVYDVIQLAFDIEFFDVDSHKISPPHQSWWSCISNKPRRLCRCKEY